MPRTPPGSAGTQPADDRTPALDVELAQGAYSASRRRAPQTAFDLDMGGRNILTDDVRSAPLRGYAQKQLEGRLAYYAREYAGEPNERRRAEFRRELDRTRAELTRRETKAARENVVDLAQRRAARAGVHQSPSLTTPALRAPTSRAA